MARRLPRTNTRPHPSYSIKRRRNPPVFHKGKTGAACIPAPTPLVRKRHTPRLSANKTLLFHPPGPPSQWRRQQTPPPPVSSIIPEMKPRSPLLFLQRGSELTPQTQTRRSSRARPPRADPPTPRRCPRCRPTRGHRRRRSCPGTPRTRRTTRCRQ